MTELSSTQIHHLMKRFPKIELSYETIPHKKVSSSYNVCLAIPTGKKCYGWFTFYGNKNVCFLADLNREKKITQVQITNAQFHSSLSLGTLVYGTLIEDTNDNGVRISSIFIIEDIFYYKGIPIRNLFFSEKLGFLQDMLINAIPQTYESNSEVKIGFALPVMWGITQKEEFDCEYNIPEKYTQYAGYTIHHIQYRCLNDTAPYMNSFSNRKTTITVNDAINEKKWISSGEFRTVSRFVSSLRMDYTKPQYRYSTIFLVSADIQFDIYHLFAYGRNKSTVYYNVAYIPNYKTSVFMNGIFRKIRENQNLDAIEESDDEDDFENIAEDKFVNLEKIVLMECFFHSKFKKWVPNRVVSGFQKVVHISQLVSGWKG